VANGLAFIDRQPTSSEVERLRLILSTFCDGSGMNDGGTMPGWRDVERTVAAALDGRASENKDVFDVILRYTSQEDVGLSIKCKNLAGRDALDKLASGGRCYMELANSPAKFWQKLSEIGLTESDYRSGKNAQKFGAAVISTVHSWHIEAASGHEKSTGRRLNLHSSLYLALSSGRVKGSEDHMYQWHSFSLSFPQGIRWEFKSEKCLSGYDPAEPKKVIFDWYGLSGGQLKYYPKGVDALFSSPPFTLERTGQVSLAEKAARYFPGQWNKINRS
jgi:hypothetical protein